MGKGIRMAMAQSKVIQNRLGKQNWWSYIWLIELIRSIRGRLQMVCSHEAVAADTVVEECNIIWGTYSEMTVVVGQYERELRSKCHHMAARSWEWPKQDCPALHRRYACIFKTRIFYIVMSNKLWGQLQKQYRRGKHGVIIPGRSQCRCTDSISLRIIIET